MPKVSVIMGIYNCETTLSESIESLLSQTFFDWDLIMCDDGSIDDTYNIAFQYSQKYSNIKVLRNDKNMGLNYTLNKCLQNADGEYIARMDGDDISLQNRFEKEVACLDENPDIAFVSTAMEYFDENEIWKCGHAKERPNYVDLIKGSPFCHAPCMIRKCAFDTVGGYTVDPKLLRVEDYHLWFKMYMNGFVGINIDEPLYRMRDDKNATKRRKFKYRLNEAYVKWLICRGFKLPIYYYLLILRPIIVGLLPSPVYEYLHHKK